MKRLVVIPGVVLVVAVAAYAFRDRLPGTIAAWPPGDSAAAPASSQAAARENAGQRAIAVKAEPAASGSLPVLRQTIGTTVPLQMTQLSSNADGMVRTVVASDGAVVKAGDLIVQLDDTSIRAQTEKDRADMAKDQATLDDANASLARIEELVAKGVDTKQQGDDARAAVHEAEAAVTADEAQLGVDQVALDYTKILAPFDGRLGAVSVSPGAYLAAGAPVVTLTQMQPLMAEFALPERDLGLARDAIDNSQLTVDVTPQGGSDKPETGPVTFIDNAVDPASGTFKLRATLPNEAGALWPGQSINVTAKAADTPNLVIVPDAAVEPRDDGFVAYVVNPEKTIETRPVTVALRVDGKAGLSAGVKAGDLVVTEGQALLRDGSRVTVATSSPGEDDGANGTGQPAAAQ